jgi:metal-responsive CopG/Arc/MetJ family transcriptional regulator
MSNTKMVRIPTSLEEEFDKLPNKSNWDPTGFSEFVREAVRYYLRREARRNRLEIEESEELDPLE